MARTVLYSRLRRVLGLASLPATDEPAHPTRRRFLAASGLAALGAACGAGRVGPGRGMIGRVGIVGAGLAGLHCAHLLKKAGVRAQVFDAATRTGGRTFTTRGRFANGQIAELGGEFIDSHHASIRGLCRELELPLDDLAASGPGALRWYFEGQLVDEAQLVAAFRPLAAAMASAMAPADPDSRATLDRTSIAEWLDGVPEASALVKKVVSVAYVGELGLEAEQQSALNLLTMIDFEDPGSFAIYGDSDERWHVRDGSDAVVARLAGALDGQIRLGARLEALSLRPDGSYRLSFGGARDENFDHVVLALPFTMLREVDLRLELPPKKLRAIRELGYGTNAKILGGFTTRPWRTLHGASGTAFTDDGAQIVWDATAAQTGASGVLTNFVGGQTGVLVGNGAPEDRWRAALGLVEPIFPGLTPAYVRGSAIRMHWPSSPFSRGSYSCYRPGQWALRGAEGRRFGNLHFCGEHTSVDHQGFMEGACESGARAADEVLGDP